MILASWFAHQMVLTYFLLFFFLVATILNLGQFMIIKDCGTGKTLLNHKLHYYIILVT